MKKLRSSSPEETFDIARAYGQKLHAGTVLALIGELGAGKTRFVQGLAAGLGVPDSTYVRSPSFTLMNHYAGGRLPIYHFDFYRLSDVSELDDLGLDEYFYGDGITVVEWPDRFPGSMPETAFTIRFAIVGEGQRDIEFA